MIAPSVAKWTLKVEGSAPKQGVQSGSWKWTGAFQSKVIAKWKLEMDGKRKVTTHRGTARRTRRCGPAGGRRCAR